MVVFKKRPGPNRKFIWLGVGIFCFHLMPFFGEKGVLYTYTQIRYDWKIPEFSQFNSITSAVSLAVMSLLLFILDLYSYDIESIDLPKPIFLRFFSAQALIIPALKILNVQDTVILIVLGSISTVSRIVDTIAKEAWMFYAGMLKLILLQFEFAKEA